MYILEHEGEAKRLEEQSKQKAYSIEEELVHLTIEGPTKILDAGCGAGVLSRYLSQQYPNSQIHGCDYSDLRIQQAKAASPIDTFKNISYSVEDLESLSFMENTFDVVICRYVFEYLKNPIKVTKEFERVLKPGATVYLIDVDGILVNLFTPNLWLQKQLEKLHSNNFVDLFVGRKLPYFIHEAKFSAVQWGLTVHSFQGRSLSEEIENNKKRCSFARPSFIEIFGSEQKTDTFIETYLQELSNPQCTLFHNKFIAWGVKSL